MRARAEAIEGFVAVLQELRRSVGNPPFREMSGRSGAISHTTLHEATKGNRLPSWETTVEFVKACGADPAEYRERWEKANRTVRSVSAGEPMTAAAHPPGEPAASAVSTEELPTAQLVLGSQAPESAGEISVSDISASDAVPPSSGESADDLQAAVPAPGGRGRFRLTRPAAVALVALAAVAIGTGVVVALAVSRGSGSAGDDQKPSGTGSKAAPSPADCPVVASNPASAPPMHSGDAAAFIADITLPDCTTVGVGRTVTKVWRLKNTGTVPWKGYSLRRLDLPQQSDQCQTISDVPIADTRPGEMVDIRTYITTRMTPGLCYVRFKLVDASGRIAFPGNRPVNFQIIVEGGT